VARGSQEVLVIGSETLTPDFGEKWRLNARCCCSNKLFTQGGFHLFKIEKFSKLKRRTLKQH
jgi:hypothetical protein